MIGKVGFLQTNMFTAFHFGLFLIGLRFFVLLGYGTNNGSGWIDINQMNISQRTEKIGRGRAARKWEWNWNNTIPNPWK